MIMDNRQIQQPQPGMPQWKGYSFRELEYRRDVNTVRQALLSEQLRNSFSAISRQREQLPVVGFISRFNSWMQIAEYGIAGMSVYSKIKSFFKRLKRG